MKEFTNETSSELLTQLIDGELDSSLEASLYDELASSTELQYELKNHLAVRNAIQKDTEAFTPPPESVKAIFDSLGYAPPPNASNSIIRRSPLLFTFFKRSAVPLAILLIASFTAYNIFNNNMNVNADSNSNYSNNTTNNIENTSNIIKNIVEKIDKNVVQNNKINNSGIANNKTKLKNSIPLISSRETNDKKENTIIVVSNNSNLVTDNFNTHSKIDLSNIELNRLNTKSLDNTTQFNPIFNMSEILNSNSNNFAIYLKGINNINNDLGNPFINNDNSLNNISLGFTYLNSGFFKLGFEIGQQRFAARETNPENEFILINSTQSVFWYAATIKHNADYLEVLNTQPYIQAAIGSGNFGKYMTRFSIGLECKPFNNSSLGFITGYENSNLMYSIQNNTQSLSTSSNCYFFGLTYGF